jgi:hypothetical protein
MLLDDRSIRSRIPTSYYCLMNPDPGGPKAYGSESGSATLVVT